MTNIPSVSPDSDVPAPDASAPAPSGAFVVLTKESVNSKQQTTRHLKAKQSSIDIRRLHWPEITDKDLWLLGDRKRGGFAQVPRTLSLVMNIINDITKRKYGKAVPAGRTYNVLWLHHFGEGLVKIHSESDAAYEAGYEGERNISTFRNHMTILKEIGFIDFRRGTKGPMQYVLMRNPYTVLKRLHDEADASGRRLVSDEQYAALLERVNDIGSRGELEE